MPLNKAKPGSSKKQTNAVVSNNIKEQSTGPKHKANEAKFGKKKAHQIDVAIAESAARRK